MKLMRLAMCVAAFAVIGKIALAEDVDVRALQQKLAAQEARLNDLQAKVNYSEANANYAGAPESILSIQKNACVTIGGLLNTRYWYNDVKIKSYDSWGVNAYDYNNLVPTNVGWGSNAANGNAGQQTGLVDPALIAAAGGGAIAGQQAAFNSAGRWGTKARAKLGDFTFGDAKLRVKIDVNDYFDAYIQMDLESSSNNASDNAEKFWIRWKNICNSGFGVKVGRDALVFGQGGVGVPSSWAAGNGDGIGRVGAGPFGQFISTDNNDSAVWSAVPAHARWDTGRIMQVTPYWEGLDGRFIWEVSFMQKAHNDEWNQNLRGQNAFAYQASGHGYPNYKSKNYGFGTISSRIQFSPIEGLDLQASVANFYDKAPGVTGGNYGLWNSGALWNAGLAGGSTLGDRWSKNNTMVDLGFNYRPCFFPKVKVWSQWVHGWNVDNMDDYDSDVINAGISYDFTEAFTLYVQGDYMNVRDGKNIGYANGQVSSKRKATGWAAWGGLQYRLPYGVSFEAGYKWESIKFKNQTNFVNYDDKRAKVTGNTFFAQVGFEF